MDHSVRALTDCSVVFVPHPDLIAITATAPHLTRLMWLSTTIDAAIQREMIASVGRRTPLQHLAHTFCELYLRLEVVGLAEDGKFRFPITQSELADVLGLSLVHTNRTVQDLRATGLVQWNQTEVDITDFDRLTHLAGFDPDLPQPELRASLSGRAMLPAQPIRADRALARHGQVSRR